MLLVNRYDVGAADENLLHWHIKQSTERKQVIHFGQADPTLPFVNGLRFFKAKVGLQIPNRQPTLLPQARDIFPGCAHVDGRKRVKRESCDAE